MWAASKGAEVHLGEGVIGREACCNALQVLPVLQLRVEVARVVPVLTINRQQHVIRVSQNYTCELDTMACMQGGPWGLTSAVGACYQEMAA